MKGSPAATALSPSEKIGLLRRTPLFSGLSGSQLEELAGLTVERSYQAGEFILFEGDRSDWFYFIRQGRVKVVKQTPAGKDFILAVFLPGEMFGAVAVFKDIPYPASAQAIDRTSVLGIKRNDFLAFMARKPEVALKIINILSERLEKAHDRLRDLATERVEQRVARMLLMLSSKLGASLPFTKQEIADMSGTTRETAIRIMSRLSKGNIVRSTRGKVAIQDEKRLRLLAEGPPSV
jgi:CRP/FNR family transcriptional regulator, nitrogen oxide reductase regulator